MSKEHLDDIKYVHKNLMEGLKLPPIKMSEKLTITKIILIQNNRMLRVGVGKHTGEWFMRIDLWWVGYRLTWNKK